MLYVIHLRRSCVDGLAPNLAHVYRYRVGFANVITCDRRLRSLDCVRRGCAISTF